MSDVVERTLTALPGLLSLDLQTGAGKLSSTSKLGNLIRSITELTSKHVSNVCNLVRPDSSVNIQTAMPICDLAS